MKGFFDFKIKLQAVLTAAAAQNVSAHYFSD